MKETAFLICPFCGQTLIIDQLKDYDPDKEPDPAMYCSCEKAVRKQRLTRAYAAVEDVCVTRAEVAGFEPLGQERVRQLQAACDSLVDGNMDIASFSYDDGDSIRMWLKGANVVVKRTRRLELKAIG